MKTYTSREELVADANAAIAQYFFEPDLPMGLVSDDEYALYIEDVQKLYDTISGTIKRYHAIGKAPQPERIAELEKIIAEPAERFDYLNDERCEILDRRDKARQELMELKDENAARVFTYEKLTSRLNRSYFAEHVFGQPAEWLSCRIKPLDRQQTDALFHAVEECLAEVAKWLDVLRDHTTLAATPPSEQLVKALQAAEALSDLECEELIKALGGVRWDD